MIDVLKFIAQYEFHFLSVLDHVATVQLVE